MNDRWPRALGGLLLLGASLVLVIPAGVHGELLPGDLGSPWVWRTFLGGVACCFIAFVGFLLLAKRRGKGAHELVILGALALLLGSFLVYSLTLGWA